MNPNKEQYDNLNTQYEQLLTKHQQLTQVLAAMISVYGKDSPGAGTIAVIPLASLDRAEGFPFVGISRDETSKYMILLKPFAKPLVGEFNMLTGE